MSMKIDKYVNKVLFKIFGPEDAKGNRTAWFHSQNLNEDRDGNPKGFPWEGRWWLHYKHRAVHAFSWHMPSKCFAFGLGTESEDGALQLHVAVPPISLWFNVGVPKSWWKHEYFNTHEFHFFEFRVFDWTLWWKFFQGSSWTSGTPKWRDGNFHIKDFILGDQKYSKTLLEIKEVQIPMPEGMYKATAKKEEAVWKRQRWFAKQKVYVTLDIPDGIPHEGKGESEWNCGEDALHGCSAEDTYEAAIASAVESVLTSRRKYNGNMMAVYPSPEERSVRVAEIRKKNAENPPMEYAAEAAHSRLEKN